MKTPHKVNYYYALFFILIGIIGFTACYLSEGDFQLTSLIPAFFGLTLLILTKGMKRENVFISHLAVVLTIVFSAVLTYMFTKNLSPEFNDTRKFYIFIVSAIVSYLVVGIYIVGFINEKRNT